MIEKIPLNEYFEMCPGGICEDLLTEEEKRQVANGTLYLSGIMQRADARNQNGRIYPRRVLEREINNYQRLINENRALGEMNHPDSEVVNLLNASHMIVKMWWNGNDVMGKLKVLSTPSGKILESLVRDGVKLGISSRGLGSVTESAGNKMVGDDFELICFDMVSEPSTVNAFMLEENVKRARQIFDKPYRLNKLMNEILEA